MGFNDFLGEYFDSSVIAVYANYYRLKEFESIENVLFGQADRMASDISKKSDGF